MSLRIRRVTGWATSIALAFGFIALSGAPANASASDDLAWIGTSAAQPTLDALQTMTAGSSTPSAMVTQPPTLGNVLAADATSFYFVQYGNLVKSDLTGGSISTVKANLSAVNVRLTNVVGLTISGGNAYLIGYQTISGNNAQLYTGFSSAMAPLRGSMQILSISPPAFKRLLPSSLWQPPQQSFGAQMMVCINGRSEVLQVPKEH